MSIRLAHVVVATVGVALACRRSTPESGASEDTAGAEAVTAVTADGACAPGVVTPEALPALVALNDPKSLVRLPRSLWRREFNHPRGAAWVAPDGSQMMIVAMDTVPDMASGEDLTGVLRRLQRPSYRSASCQMVVDGRAASLSTGTFVDSGGADTVFSVSATAIVRPGLAFAATGLTPSLAMRDSLVAIVGSVRFTDR